VNADSDHQTRFTATDVIAVIMMNLFWGLNIVAVKMGVDLIDPLTSALLRQVMVLIICLPALKLIPGKMPELLSLGILSGGLFYIITNVSFRMSDNIPALAIAGQLGGPFSLILAVILLKERVHAFRIIGMTLAFSGVAILVFDPHAFDQRDALLLSVAASLIWAICSLIQRQLGGVPVLTIYAWVGLIGTIVLLPCALIFEPQSVKHIAQLPLNALGWILFSALGSTIFGQGAMSYLIQRHPVSTVIPLSLATPVIGVVTSAWWFSTPFTPVMIVGGLIVLTGIAIVTIRTAQVQEMKVG
jgi:O-acetylserine/cysteine efflux transporter